MAKISTKELFDRYYATKDEKFTYKTRPQVDRPEVYAYEQKIGKQLVDMDVDEIFDMLLTFNGNRRLTNSMYNVSYSSYDNIASFYRSIFNYYIENVEVIKNPFYDKRMRGSEAAKRLSQDKVPISIERVEEIIDRLHQDCEESRANYVECIMRLYMEGFSCAEEIVLLKEENINFETHVVTLGGRGVHLSDTCFDLLLYVHKMGEIDGWQGNLIMVSWHDHYFKYAIRKKSTDKFQELPAKEVANKLNRELAERVRYEYGVELSYRKLYLLGFYEYLVGIYGEDRVYELVTSVRDSKAVADLTKAARSYGVVFDNVTKLKQWLRPFLKHE